MQTFRHYIALAAIGTAAGFAVPAFAAETVVDQAQCNEAKGSGEQTAIRQFCPVEDWPQTVEPAVRDWVMAQDVQSVTYSGDVVVGTVLPADVQLIEVPDYTDYRWAYLNDHRVVVVPDTRTVIATY